MAALSSVTRPSPARTKLARCADCCQNRDFHSGTELIRRVVASGFHETPKARHTLSHLSAHPMRKPHLAVSKMLPDQRPLAAIRLVAPHAGLLPMQEIGQHRAVGDISRT